MDKIISMTDYNTRENLIVALVIVYLPYIHPLFHNLSKFLIQALQLAELIGLCVTIKRTKYKVKQLLYNRLYLHSQNWSGTSLQWRLGQENISNKRRM